MTTEANKALVRQFFAMIDSGAVREAIDTFLAPDYQDRNPPPAPGLAPGRGGVHQAAELIRAALPDAQHTIEEQIAEGDVVVTRLTASGTHTGELMGIPPTGKRITASGISMHRVVDGKLVEKWSQTDFLGMLQQLGAIPAPAPTT